MNRIISNTTKGFEYLLSKITPLSRLYMQPYKRIVQNELYLADIPSRSNVLQIGAGPVPYTAVYLAQMGNLYVTAIDRDPSAVRYAREWIWKMGMANRVEAVYTEAIDYDLSRMVAAFIALQVEPKEQVMDYIMNNGNSGFKIIVREPSKRYSSQYDPIPSKWIAVSRIYQGMPTFKHSNLYIKT